MTETEWMKPKIGLPTTDCDPGSLILDRFKDLIIIL